MRVLLSILGLLAMSIASYAADGQNNDALNNDLDRAEVEAPLAVAGTSVADSTPHPDFTFFTNESELTAVVRGCDRIEEVPVETALSGLEIEPGVTQNCGPCSASAFCVGLPRGSWCGNGKVCEIYLGFLCSDNETWDCLCYNGIIP